MTAPTQKDRFLAEIATRVLVADGAMGTMLGQQLPLSDLPAPALNLSHPSLVAEVHHAYLNAGARLIETNTYGASRPALEAYGLDGVAPRMAHEGAAIARRCADPFGAWVAGAIGPIGAAAVGMSDDVVVAAYHELALALVLGGASVLMLETFGGLHDFKLALQGVRQAAPDHAVIGQFAFTLSRMTAEGLSVRRMVEALDGLDVDVIGANCGGGESAALNIATELVTLTTKPISILPNRGLAEIDEEGQPHYQTGSEYFAVHGEEIARLGVNIVGGCCGTSPNDIAALVRRIGTMTVQPRRRTARIARQAPSLAPKARRGGVPFQPHVTELSLNQTCVIAEVDPPRGLEPSAQLRGAEALLEAGADSITVADNPLSVMRMSNLALATLLIRELSANVTLHVACRDRNMIGTQSHLLGAAALGITNVLAITGDPIATQSYRGLKGVFDMSSVNLMRLIAGLNAGEFLAGRQIEFPPNFCVGGAFNSAALGFENEVKKARRKQEAGARYLLTQPVFSVEAVDRLVEHLSGLGMRLFVGIMPLLGERNADFLHNEVPGISIPADVRERLRGKDKKAGRIEGQKIAETLIARVADHGAGVYLVTPMDHYGLVADLTRFAKSLPTPTKGQRG